jgi:F-box-like
VIALDELPVELLMMICERCDYASVVALSATCRLLYGVTGMNCVWESVYHRTFAGVRHCFPRVFHEDLEAPGPDRRASHSAGARTDTGAARWAPQSQRRNEAVTQWARARHEHKAGEQYTRLLKAEVHALAHRLRSSRFSTDPEPCLSVPVDHPLFDLVQLAEIGSRCQRGSRADLRHWRTLRERYHEEDLAPDAVEWPTRFRARLFAVREELEWKHGTADLRTYGVTSLLDLYRACGSGSAVDDLISWT